MIRNKGKKSNWDTVYSEVSQVFVLGPLLFIIYMNYLDSGGSRNISKFALDRETDQFGSRSYSIAG